MSEDRRKKLATTAGLAGGAVLSAGYYKAARDNAILSQYGKARRAKANSLRKKKYPVFDENMDPTSKRKLIQKDMDKWEKKNRKKHGVGLGKTTRGHKVVPLRGKMVDGKFKPSTLSRLLRSDWAFKRAYLPKALLGKIPNFK